MSVIQYHFTEMDSDASMQTFAQALGTSYSGNSVIINPPAGKGVIKKLTAEPGLNIRVFDLEPAYAIEFCKTAGAAGGNKKFHLVFFLSYGDLLIKKKKINSSLVIPQGMNILFSSDDINVELELPANEPFKSVYITLTAEWLQQAYSAAEETQSCFINKLCAGIGSSLFFECTTLNEYRTLNELYSACRSDKTDILQIRSEALYLISHFFAKLFNRSLEEVLSSKFVYQEKMVAVEKMLQASVEKKLPSVDTIAKQVSMSVSTLKRYFKLMFGKSIYDYYLALKMDHGRKLILEDKLNVNEVAYRLDYEKASNFIDMFKKYFKVSPGSLRKQYNSDPPGGNKGAQAQ